VIRARFRETIREGFLPEVEENELRMVVRDKRQAEPGSPGHEICLLALHTIRFLRSINFRKNGG
jgi:hypothetical protein